MRSYLLHFNHPTEEKLRGQIYFKASRPASPSKSYSALTSSFFYSSTACASAPLNNLAKHRMC